MMLNKKSLALLSALLVTSNATADLRTKSGNEEISNVIHSMDDIGAIVKKIPMNSIREVNSETCENETFDLLMNQGVQDAMSGVDADNYATSSYCSGSETKVSCDFKDAYSSLEAACDTAGGQLFQYSVSVKGEGASISFKNMADCIGASCDTAAAIEAQEELYSFFTLIGFKETIQESGASTLSSTALAMIALIDLKTSFRAKTDNAIFFRVNNN